MNPVIIDLIDDALAATIEKQTFFQRWAGTIVPIIAALGSALGGYAAAVGADADHAQTAVIIAAVAAVVTGLASRFTKNGNTPTTQRRTRAQLTTALEAATATQPPNLADYVQQLRHA